MELLHEVVSHELKIISIKDFEKVNFIKRILVNRVIESNNRNNFSLINGLNFAISQEYFFSELYSKFVKVSEKIFGNFNISYKNSNTCWCYRSNKKNTISVYHNHINTSTINSVYYYQLNKNDGIIFLDDSQNKFYYYPKPQELLIFPNYLIHKPMLSEYNKYRYSINMEILTEETSSELFSRVFN